MVKEMDLERIVDIHCHILPALDDGSRNLQETVEMLRIAERSGITDIIATPHYKAGRHNASRGTLLKRLHEVQEEAGRQGISVRLYAGNEVYYFSDFEQAMDAGQICTMNRSRYVLIEFSPAETFRTIHNAMDQVLGIGYYPILAHAERYGCMLEDWKNLDYLKTMGVEIQVNASSVEGQTGHKVKKFVHRLLENRLADYIGTDAHGSVQRIPDIQKCCRQLFKKYDDTYVEKILCGNAMKLLFPQETWGNADAG